jgi:hypothetical protein
MCYVVYRQQDKKSGPSGGPQIGHALSIELVPPLTTVKTLAYVFTWDVYVWHSGSFPWIPDRSIRSRVWRENVLFGSWLRFRWAWLGQRLLFNYSGFHALGVMRTLHTFHKLTPWKSPALEDNGHSADQETPRLLCSPEIHRRVHKSPPVPIPSQTQSCPHPYDIFRSNPR